MLFTQGLLGLGRAGQSKGEARGVGGEREVKGERTSSSLVRCKGGVRASKHGSVQGMGSSQQSMAFLYGKPCQCMDIFPFSSPALLIVVVVDHGSSSLPFVMKVMFCHFVSDSHEVMTALIVVLRLIVVVEIPLQLHGSCCCFLLVVVVVSPICCIVF